MRIVQKLRNARRGKRPVYIAISTTISDKLRKPGLLNRYRRMLQSHSTNSTKSPLQGKKMNGLSSTKGIVGGQHMLKLEKFCRLVQSY